MQSRALLACAALAGFVVGCGSPPADYEGAENTEPIPTAPNACAQLAQCCLADPESEQSLCLAAANRGVEVDCSLDLGERRARGTCPAE